MGNSSRVGKVAFNAATKKPPSCPILDTIFKVIRLWGSPDHHEEDFLTTCEPSVTT